MSLPVEQRRAHAEDVLRAAIAAAEPGPLVRRALHGAPELAGGEPIHLLAIGKAAAGMAAPILEEYRDRVVRELVVLPRGTRTHLPALHGAHPLPDESSVEAGAAVRALLDDAGTGDLVLALLSGGGSAVVAAPLGDITIDDYAATVDRLLRAGADITELNIVRRHMDALKGGRMATLATPAAVLCLVLSDVVGDAPETVASGPFSPDATTAADALRVLQRHGGADHFPASVRRLLEHDDPHCRAPHPDDPAFDNARVRVVGGNIVAVEGAARRAAELGYRVHRAIDPVTGPAREAGESLAREARLIQREHPLPACIVAGGETTVAVTGDGRGGRNQELALAACLELRGLSGITIGSAGTDGVDGPTDAAGAIVDEESIAAAVAHGIAADAALRDNDSNSFHAAAGGLLVTGPTGTNVNDVHIALIDVPAPLLPLS